MIANTHTTYIEPYRTGDVGTVVFNKSDYRKRGAAFTCGVTGEEIKSVPNLLRKNNVVNISSGGSLRTYRLALAATGEYTAVLGGTIARRPQRSDHHHEPRPGLRTRTRRADGAGQQRPDRHQWRH